MDSLYVLEAGCYLRRDGETLKICRNGEVLRVIPAAGLEKLTLVGRASLSGAVLDFLLNRKVDTVFLTPEGRFRGRLLLDDKGHVDSRIKQYRTLSDKDTALKTGRLIVHGKIENQVRLLLIRARSTGVAEMRQSAMRLRALQKSLAGAGDLDAVRGIEGFAAKLYYAMFPFLIRNDDFSFTGRNRRPPRDPVNALLSFVYTLFTNEVQSAVKAVGLDPYLGSLHEPSHGRPSLVCDLVEEWRVLADRLVLALINRKLVSKDDFIIRKSDKDGSAGLPPVEMKPQVLRALVRSYERQMAVQYSDPGRGDSVVLRALMHRQVSAFKRSVEEQDVLYRPFVLPM